MVKTGKSKSQVLVNIKLLRVKMSSDDEDTRIPCKYGASCYQKNPTHHEKFKHPDKRGRSESPESSNTFKKQKNDNETSPTKTKESPEKQKKAKENKTNENREKQKNASATNDISSSDDDWVNDVNLLDLETLADRKEFIKKHFLVEMPDDFYTFWDFCKELNKDKPNEAFKSVGLTLVGPYDVLDDSFRAVDDSQKYFLHWRYYYDPPEFQTIIKGDDKSGYHIGYFRDSPEEKPLFIGHNEANKNCIISQLGENVFGAINTYMEKVVRTADPFKKMSLTKLQKSVQNKARELKLNLNSHGKSRKTVCKSFHTAGIVVPYTSSTQLGYRPLPVDDKGLKKLLNQVEKAYEEGGDKAFSSLQPVITAATIANDECDFGTSLELGINMFCFGHKCFNTSVVNLLKVTYALLNRHAFGEIIEEHLKCRKKENPHIINLSK